MSLSVLGSPSAVVGLGARIATGLRRTRGGDDITLSPTGFRALGRLAATHPQISGWVAPVLIPFVTAAIVALLHPPTWSVVDDTTILRQADVHGAASVFWTYSGYLAVVQRVIALVEAPAPLIIGAFGSYLAVALVAMFLVRRVHPAAVLALVLAPIANVYGTLSNIQWVLAVYLIAMLVATPPTSPRGRLVDAVGIFACGLTGPFSILPIPLYGIRAVNPVWRWHLIVLAFAASIQAVALTVTFRPPAPEHDLAAVMIARAAIPILVIALCGFWLPRRWVFGALYVATAIAALGVTGTLHSTSELLSGAGERYFYLPWVIAIGSAALAMASGRLRDSRIRSRFRNGPAAPRQDSEWVYKTADA